jgi:hypothetical protein
MKMMPTFFTLTILITVLTGVPLVAGAEDISCPAKITVSQKIAKHAPPWAVSYSTLPSELEEITFYDGPPSEMASLVYDDEKVAGGNTVAIWHFSERKTDSDFWFSCGYAHTTAILSRKIPKSLTECSVTYSKDETIAGHYLIKSFSCK